jgi:hypothetical protein
LEFLRQHVHATVVVARNMCTRCSRQHVHATCFRVGAFPKATCARNMCCCTQHVLATCSRRCAAARNMCTHATCARVYVKHTCICCRTNICTCTRATCLHMLHATFARVHMYVSSESSYRPTCARNICTCTMCVVARRSMCTCVCTCMGLALGLAMNQYVYATCVLHTARARVHIVRVIKVSSIVISCTWCTQHVHVSTTCDVRTCTEKFILPSISIRSGRS